MDKIQIKGLVQGKKKLEDGSFAVGFRTLYGIVWIVPGNLHKFFTQNEHLSFLRYRASVEEEEVVSRYINVTNKAQQSETLGVITVNPRL